MNKNKIAILTTVANFELYKETSKRFPQGIEKFVIDGRNGMHGIHSIFYMMKKLKNKDINWLVMMDEDVILKDAEVIFDIIEEMNKNDYTICGIRDGGVIKHRRYNPYVINTFFSVIDFNELKKVWNPKEIRYHQRIEEGEFEDDLSNLRFDYDAMSLFEPYYCFYFWLRRMKKNFLFLDSEMKDDEISNSLIFKEMDFGVHTWYARSYGFNKKHTDRINDHLGSFDPIENSVDNFVTQPIYFKDKSFYFVQKLRRFYRKIAVKLNR